MYININNSEVINKATQVEVGGTTYPRAVFGDTEKLNSLGIYKLTEDAIPNRRYYTYNEVVNVKTRNIDRTPIPRDVDSLKATMLSELKQMQKDKLSDIDWYWLREQKIGTPVPSEINELASYIYTKSNEIEVAIDSLNTIDDIILYEATPYEYTYTEEDIAEDIDSNIKVGDTVTRYKNNLKDW